jgi:hypothetical protein
MPTEKFSHSDANISTTYSYGRHVCISDVCKGKGKGRAHNRPQGPKGVPGRLRPRIFLTFGTTRVVGRQPHAPAALTPRGIPWYSFLEDESTPGHMVPSVATEKIPSVTPSRIGAETVRLVAQCLNHCATTPGISDVCTTYNSLQNKNLRQNRAKNYGIFFRSAQYSHRL